MRDEWIRLALDRLEKLKQKKDGRKTAFVIIVLVGVVLGVGLAFVQARLGISESMIDSVFLLHVLFATLLGVLLHETGHLLFGLVSGYSFHSFRVFVFLFYKKEGKLRFAIHHVAGTAGQCLMYPPERKDREIPQIWYHLGGVILNTLTFAACLTLLLLFWHDMPRFFQQPLIANGIISATMALSNGIPVKTAALTNDGYHVFLMSKSADARKAATAQLRINAALLEGKRLGEMPSEWFTVGADAVSGDRLVSVIRILRGQRLMDMGCFREAEETLSHIAAYEKEISRSHFYTVMAELLYLEMMNEHRREAVERLRYALSDHCKATRNSLTTLRVETTFQYLFVGDPAEIARNEAALERLYQKSPFAGDVASERFLLSRPREIYRNWMNGGQ